MDVKIKLWYKNSTPKNITQPFINQQLVLDVPLTGQDLALTMLPKREARELSPSSHELLA